MKGMCAKCEKRDICTELCEKAEKYADQDAVKMKHPTIENADIYDASIAIKPSYSPIRKEWLSIMSKREKEVIKMRYEDGLTFNQIAEKLKISTSSVRSYLNRVISKLHTTLQ